MAAAAEDRRPRELQPRAGEMISSATRSKDQNEGPDEQPDDEISTEINRAGQNKDASISFSSDIISDGWTYSGRLGRLIVARTMPCIPSPVSQR